VVVKPRAGALVVVTGIDGAGFSRQCCVAPLTQINRFRLVCSAENCTGDGAKFRAA